VATIIRVPLASGMLTGKLSPSSTFAADDHRNFNRHGEQFDVGETFSGVPYETGLQVVEELKKLVPGGATMAQLALKWILMFDGVSTIIPGAKSPKQVEDNAAASGITPLSEQQMQTVRALYDQRIRPHVHQRW
jgi:aryl-alcohol dehydrogenase-like predicted oxidoreductase